MMIAFTKKNGKYIFNKDGVYFALTPLQVLELQKILNEIIYSDMFSFKGG